MRWACILLPQLALDGVLRGQPDPDAPLALVTGPVHRRVPHAVNPAARALGLRPGLSLAAAQALGVSCTTVEYNPVQHERWRELLAAWAYRFSSQVSTALPHAIVLEVAHSLRLFGPWPLFERRLRDELRGLGFRHRIIAAPNPYAARVLANAHDGLAVDHAVLDTALGQLPVERAGLSREVAQALSRMGLRTLRQVYALPRDAIVRRFPPPVLDHLDCLRGALAPPLPAYRPPDRFAARLEFEYEVESSQALLFPLRRLTADLAAYLAGRDGGVQRFGLVLEHERMPDSEITVGLLAPERDAAMLFELARGRIEQVRVPAAVRAMQLLVHELPPFVPAANDLFDARAQQAVPWPQLRERLRARLGDASVRGIGWRADHRPERVVEGAPIAAGTPSPSYVPRPGWLLQQAVPLRDHHVRVLAGPERIESGWWDDGDIRRDYYLVETSQGQRAWVYCEAGEPGPQFDEALMLHGWFA